MLDTKKIGSAKVKLLITLFGTEGKLWIDQLNIAPYKESAAQNAAAAGEIYRNPDFRSSIARDGKVRLFNHWINGKVSPAETYNGRPAIRLESVFLPSWNSYVGSIGQPTKDSLPPGKYTFSIWCCPEKGVTRFGLYYGRVSGETGKRIASFRKYMPFEMPKEGEWTELAMNFEVKPGDRKMDFFFCFWGEKDKGSTALFADPKIVREEDAE